MRPTAVQPVQPAIVQLGHGKQPLTLAWTLGQLGHPVTAMTIAASWKIPGKCPNWTVEYAGKVVKLTTFRSGSGIGEFRHLDMHTTPGCTVTTSRRATMPYPSHLPTEGGGHFHETTPCPRSPALVLLRTNS